MNRIGPTELSKLINTYKQNIYGIYKRKSIDTHLLSKISKDLSYNFFSHYYSDEVLGAYDKNPVHTKLLKIKS